MKKPLLILMLSAITHGAYPITDNVGSGRAIRFDGIDDYIDLGNIYDDIALPITISAWIYIDPQNVILTFPIFDSQDNSAIYNGFTLITSSIPHAGFTYGDGQGGNNPAFRRARAGYFQTMGRWVYITATATSGSNIEIYMNGYRVSSDYQGSSNLPMNSNSPTEVAKIGYLFSNGNIFHFKGIMDELRIWNRSLSEQEIRQTMCQKLKGNEAGLIGYWTFDETEGDVLKDLSSKGFHGQLKGNPTRVFSGAPVGDESVFLYPTSWADKSLIKDDLSVVNVSGNPFGVHIYKINTLPSQTGGLNLGTVKPPYYGVFLAADDAPNTFDLTFTGNSVCQISERTDNSIPSWNQALSLTGFAERREIIPSSEGVEVSLEVSLGNDTLLCNKQSLLLEGGMVRPGRTFLWSTGNTSPSITVSSSGAFWVVVKEECSVDRDTIQVAFLNTPPAFSLGEDEVFCTFESRTLVTNFSNEAYDVSWQDGSNESSFRILDYGIYWLKIENLCGVSADTISFSQKILKDIKHYNFMSPNNEDDLNQYFPIDEQLRGAALTVFNRWGKQVYQSANYQNDWDGNSLPSGIYFYTIRGVCFEVQKGTLTISH